MVKILNLLLLLEFLPEVLHEVRAQLKGITGFSGVFRGAAGVFSLVLTAYSCSEGPGVILAC